MEICREKWRRVCRKNYLISTLRSPRAKRAWPQRSTAIV